MVHAPVPLPSTPYALKLLAQAAALPLRDAAFALWRYRASFIREAEAQAPEAARRADERSGIRLSGVNS